MTHHFTIKRSTPDMRREQGAQAYDRHELPEDHGHPPGSDDARNHEFGWHQRRVEVKLSKKAAARSSIVDSALTAAVDLDAAPGRKLMRIMGAQA